jgi:hypothetical protein
MHSVNQDRFLTFIQYEDSLPCRQGPVVYPMLNTLSPFLMCHYLHKPVTSILRHPKPTYLPYIKDHVAHSYKATGEIVHIFAHFSLYVFTN